MTVTVEPSIFLEKEIKEDAKFTNVRDSFITWNDKQGTTPSMPNCCSKAGHFKAIVRADRMLNEL